MSLEKEQKFYEEQKADLLKHYEGQFVLIKNQKIHGFFTTEKEAFDKGLSIFGPQEMFITQVVKEEPKTFIPAFSTNSHAHF